MRYSDRPPGGDKSSDLGWTHGLPGHVKKKKKKIIVVVFIKHLHIQFASGSRFGNYRDCIFEIRRMHLFIPHWGNRICNKRRIIKECSDVKRKSNKMYIQIICVTK